MPQARANAKQVLVAARGLRAADAALRSDFYAVSGQELMLLDSGHCRS